MDVNHCVGLDVDIVGLDVDILVFEFHNINELLSLGGLRPKGSSIIAPSLIGARTRPEHAV